MYWNGAGTQVNRRLGCRWWDNAVIAGNDTAKENLRRLCKDVNLSEPAVGRKADGADDEDVRPAPEARNMKKGGNRSRPADKKPSDQAADASASTAGRMAAPPSGTVAVRMDSMMVGAL